MRRRSAQAAAPRRRRGHGSLAVSAVVVRPPHVADDLLATGALLANNSVELRNEVAGRLVSIRFEEGRPVEKGALLVKIYDVDLQAQLRKLQLDEETAARTEERQKDLLSVNGISQQEYDVALNTLNGLGAEIDVLKAQIGKTEIRRPSRAWWACAR
jgi:membrane fusion protein (multidrug efflux system)